MDKLQSIDGVLAAKSYGYESGGKSITFHFLGPDRLSTTTKFVFLLTIATRGPLEGTTSGDY